MVSLLILAYNEENFIKDCVEQYIEEFEEIIIVNDCSKDSTERILLELKQNFNNINVITNNKNLGAGKSFQIGIEYFLDTESEFLIKIDGDSQFSKKDILKIKELGHNKKLDFIKCDRFWLNGIIGKIPKLRYFGNTFASFLVKLATGNWIINDPLNGLFFISKKASKHIQVPKTFYRYGYPFYLTVLFSKISSINNLKLGQTTNTVSYSNETSQLKPTVLLYKLLFFTIKSFFNKLKFKFRFSSLQIGALLDLFFFLSFLLSFYFFFRLVLSRYFSFSGGQLGWFINTIFFFIVMLIVFYRSQVSESKFREKYFKNY